MCKHPPASLALQHFLHFIFTAITNVLADSPAVACKPYGVLFQWPRWHIPDDYREDYDRLIAALSTGETRG